MAGAGTGHGMGKIGTPQEFEQIGRRANAMIKRTGPARRLALDQLTEALATGGVGARIPMVQQAVSAQNQATSQALSQTSEQLAQRNIGGPFAARILAGTRMAGEQRAAALPTELTSQFIQQMMPFLSATQGLGFGALGQAGQAQMSTEAFNAQQFAKAMGDIKSSTSSLAAMCLHPASYIETPDGAKRVENLRIGSIVFSIGERGERIMAVVTATGARLRHAGHKFLKVQAAGGPVLVSPGHPLPNGTPIADQLGGELVDDLQNYTVDIAVGGPTGAYFVCGLALGSTLDPRHTGGLKKDAA